MKNQALLQSSIKNWDSEFINAEGNSTGKCTSRAELDLVSKHGNKAADNLNKRMFQHLKKLSKTR